MQLTESTYRGSQVIPGDVNIYDYSRIVCDVIRRKKLPEEYQFCTILAPSGKILIQSYYRAGRLYQTVPTECCSMFDDLDFPF